MAAKRVVNLDFDIIDNATKISIGEYRRIETMGCSAFWAN